MKKPLHDFTLAFLLLGAISFSQSTAKNIENSFDDSDFTEDNYQVLDVVQNTTISEAINGTVHRGFLHGFGESISVILVSEIGDKTFFIAAIMAMTNNKLTVFLAAISALAVMTVMSALLGWVVTTFIPREVTYYTCTAIMFLFGLKMLWEAWRMDDSEMEETQQEVMQDLARRGSITSTASTSIAHQLGKQKEEVAITENSNSPRDNQQGIQNAGYDKEIDAAPDSSSQTKTTLNITNETVLEKESKPVPNESNASNEHQENETKIVKNQKKNTVSWTDNVIDNSCRENSWFGKKCLKIFKLFINCFSMTFIAEWGDRSQLATIVLAGINDVGGVCVGGVLGHIICTSGAVLAGALISRYISVRKVTFFGALVFLGFAIASIFIDPNEEVPNISGYSNSTRILNKNVSLTLLVENNKYEYEN